jgi:hypothetical protein
LVRDRWGIPAAAIVCVAVWIIIFPFALLHVDAFHDGLVLNPAMDVVSGQTCVGLKRVECRRMPR